MEEKKVESTFDKGFNGALGAMSGIVVFVGLCYFIPKIHSKIKAHFNPTPPPAVAAERE